MEEKLFSKLNLSDQILRAIADMGYDSMTPIQEQIIPLVLSGKDVIGQSSTGTGKTAAFAIPAVEKAEPSEEGRTQILVLTPTRELAIQITEEMRKFSKYKEGVKTLPVYGGQTIMIQIRGLRKAEIVVGTPGRIIDHIHRGTLKLDHVKMVVLDEADEMLDMGFLDDIRYILKCCPEDRQTLLFSATMPSQILRITERFQKHPVHIKGDDGQAAFDLITQYYCEVPQGKKANSVMLLMEKLSINRALIFCNTKHMVDTLTNHLVEKGLSAVALHGDMKQSARSQVMKEFKDGQVNILIATDVAARGIDASGVEAIINYDIPQDAEYYVHRIGRTGRAGNLGVSYTIIANRGEFFNLCDIEDKTGAHLTPYILEGADALPDDRVRALNNSKASYRIAVPGKKPSGSGSSSSKYKDNPQNCLISVDVGADHDIRPSHISGAIMKYARLKKQDIGKITISQSESLIELSPENARHVMKSMQDATVNNFVVVFKAAEEPSSQAGSGHPRPRTSGNPQNRSHYRRGK
ncbi:MAG: DEAD/DEAH box helicase [Clostridiaceae bacterium]|nr:DEAD/DEAH box helicase [Clostridiaceae bacterium]